MDSVELVMSFEEEFGISIPDSAAEQMRTPRHVIDFVIAERRRIAQMDARAHLFRVLEEMGYAGVSADTAFNELFAKKGRAAEWRHLGMKLAPFSVTPAKPTHSGCVLGLTGVITIVVACFLHQWLPAAAGALLVFSDMLWTRLSVTIPEQTNTVQKLIDYLTRPIAEDKVAAKVKIIVMEQLGLRESKYGEDQRFVENLGMD